MRPDLDSVKMMIRQIKLQKEKHQATNNFMLFIPRRTIECDELLESEDLLHDERISKLDIDLIL